MAFHILNTKKKLPELKKEEIPPIPKIKSTKGSKRTDRWATKRQVKKKATAVLSGKNCYELRIAGPGGVPYLVTVSNPLMADEIVVDYLIESRAKNVQRRHITMDLSKKEV